MPADRTHLEQRARKEEKVKKILAEQTTLITYADWILQERIKHNVGAIPEATEDPSRLESCDAPQHLSSAELSSRLASSPKEEEIWATDCAICLSEFAKDEEVRELSCEHIFHDACIHSWFIKAPTCACPLCRNSLHSGLSQEELSQVAVVETQPQVVASPHSAAVEAV